MTPREIDLATIGAWPAAVTERRNGWFYLASGGVTGRVNAVWPLDWKGVSLDDAIGDVEDWYAARNLPPRFKLTDGAIEPPELPDALARRGYEAVNPTLVMIAPVGQIEAPTDVEISATLPDEFDAALRETARDASEYDERHSIALRAPAPAAFAMVRREGRVAAIGMSAASGDFAGVFLMRTIPEARRQGLGRRVLAALQAHAARREMAGLFLQVDADNAPAIALYESAGFSALTTYRFWRKAS